MIPAVCRGKRAVSWRQTKRGKMAGLVRDCLEPYLDFSCFKFNEACTGCTAPRPKLNEKKMFSKTPITGGDASLLLARIPSFIVKKLLFLSFYLAIISFSSYKSLVLSTNASQIFRSLCPFCPQWKSGRYVFSCVTSLQHELPHVLQCSLPVCCACTLALIIFWLTAVLNHQIKTNEGQSQKM